MLDRVHLDPNVSICVQRAGEAVVVPTLWGSATVSVVTGMAAGPSQPIGVQELKSLSELNRSADGPALKPGWGFAEREAERERKEAESAEWMKL